MGSRDQKGWEAVVYKLACRIWTKLCIAAYYQNLLESRFHKFPKDEQTKIKWFWNDLVRMMEE